METAHAGAVLVVEDDPDDAQIILETFRSRTGRVIDVVDNGADAMDYLLCSGRYTGNANCRAPVLVVLDLGLPGVGGLAVLHRLRDESRQPYVPVVVFTASTDEQVLNASYALGANSFISKPHDAGDFRAVMEQVAIYWLTINVLPAPAQPVGRGRSA
jgi:two-component system, response regulator